MPEITSRDRLASSLLDAERAFTGQTQMDRAEHLADCLIADGWVEAHDEALSAPWQFAVRVGPPPSGLFAGPFDTAEAAVEWREQHVTRPGLSWAIVPITTPDVATAWATS